MARRSLTLEETGSGRDVGMPHLTELELCIELINTANSPEEAFSHFCAILGEIGYHRVTYSLLTDHPSLGLPSQSGLATSYPQDWVNYYRENHYLLIDPVVLAVLASRKLVFWNEVREDGDLSAQAVLLMRQAAEAGLHSGVSFSLQGEPGEVAGIGLARQEKGEEDDYDQLARIHMLSIYFHQTYRDMLIKRHPVPVFTNREQEVLYWAAEGKTDPELAAILGITVNTVRFHWKNTFRKLNVHGRSYAITKAIRLGIIVPEIVSISYRNR